MPTDYLLMFGFETIPFKETREYVKSVLAYQQIYQHKVGQGGSLFDKIITMNINE